MRTAGYGQFVGSGLDRSGGLAGRHAPPHTPPHVGAGHARPGGVRRTGAYGKPAGRACPAPTARRQGRCEPARKVPREGQDPPLRTDVNVCLMGKCTPSHTSARRGRACPARRCTADGRLRETCGPGMPGPYREAAELMRACQEGPPGGSRPSPTNRRERVP